jgi:hypothetical protein
MESRLLRSVAASGLFAVILGGCSSVTPWPVAQIRYYCPPEYGLGYDHLCWPRRVMPPTNFVAAPQQQQFHSASASNDPPSWGGHAAAGGGSAGAGGALLGAAGRSAPEALSGTTALRAESNVARKAAIATENEEGFEVLRIFLWIFEL